MKKLVLAMTAAGVLIAAAPAFAAPVPSNTAGMSVGDTGAQPVRMMKKKMMMKRKMMMKKKMM